MLQALQHIDPAQVASAVNYIVGAVLLRYLVPWLKHHAETAKITAAQTNLNFKQQLLARVTEFLSSTAAQLGEQKLPELASKLSSGQLATMDQAKAEVQSWLDALKVDALAHFRGQNVDVLKHLGDEAVDKLIQTAGSSISAKEGSAIEGIVKPVLDEVINGVASEHCKACVPPCDTCPLNPKNAVAKE